MTTPADAHRSRRSLHRELSKIRKAKGVLLRINTRRMTDTELAQFTQLTAVDQALSWALGDNALAPSKCYVKRRHP